MSEVTNADLQKKLDALHDRLTSGEIPVTVTYPKDPMDQLPGAVKDDDPKKKEKLEAPEEFKVSKFKDALISGQPRVVTDNLLPFDFVQRFAEMYEELQKEPWTEYFEAMGLDGFAAAFEKSQEKNENWKSWLYSAIAGLFIPMVGAVIALMFLTNFKIIQRIIQKGIFNGLLRWVPWVGDRVRDKIIAMDANNRFPKLQLAQDVRDREDVAGGGMAAIPRDANFDALRTQLEKLNPELLNFNRHAPDFVSNFRKMPKEARAEKAANAVQKISDAIKLINARKLQKVAEGIEKLNLALDGFQPSKLPKGPELADQAKAMNSLAKETGTLRQKFIELRGTVQSLDQELGGAAGA
ncbi:hypothetical protein ACWDUX_05870 [Streptomyces sp. NPDC003444]|uniref:hypothetical protein n=1 Tax=Streptomyces sp. S1 TaxID=718288 RepID=UPI003D733C0C